MELKKLTIDSPDIPALEEINEEAIPDCDCWISGNKGI